MNPRTRHGLEVLFGLLVVAVACLTLGSPGVARSFVREPDADLEWDALTRSTMPDDADPHANDSERLPNGVEIREVQLRAAMSKHQGVDHWYQYRFKAGGLAVPTIAPGTDSRHHFVNSYLEGFVPMKDVSPWVPLYVIAKRKAYLEDPKQYGGADVWQTSRESFANPRGDCEDHAIALADWLIGLGKDARVVTGTYRGAGHAWVVVVEGNDTWLLEATGKRRARRWHYPPAGLHPEYVPVEMFNRVRWWQNTGGITTDYTGPHWRQGGVFTPAFTGRTIAAQH